MGKRENEKGTSPFEMGMPKNEKGMSPFEKGTPENEKGKRGWADSAAMDGRQKAFSGRVDVTQIKTQL
jgi:hypothetical protein